MTETPDYEVPAPMEPGDPRTVPPGDPRTLPPVNYDPPALPEIVTKPEDDRPEPPQGWKHNDGEGQGISPVDVPWKGYSGS